VPKKVTIVTPYEEIVFEQGEYRTSGYYSTVSVRYEGGFVIVREENGDEHAFPSCSVVRVDTITD